jgi:hypothetical protein
MSIPPSTPTMTSTAQGEAQVSHSRPSRRGRAARLATGLTAVILLPAMVSTAVASPPARIILRPSRPGTTLHSGPAHRGPAHRGSCPFPLTSMDGLRMPTCGMPGRVPSV